MKIFTFAEPPKPRPSKAVGRSGGGGGGDGLSENLAFFARKLSENQQNNLLRSVYEKIANVQVIFS